MFASVDLARRIEKAEAGLTASLGHAVISQGAQADAFVEEIAAGVAAYTGPSSPMNKMIGVGFDGVPEDRLAAIEDLFRVRKAPLQAEVATLANPVVAATLTRRGYVLENFENVLGRPIAQTDADPGSGDGIDIRPTESSQIEQWLDAAITGFQHADEQGVQAVPLPPREVFEDSLRPYMRVTGFHRYCAWIGGDLAGVATLRMDSGVAQLCGAATLPRFRRRGVQTRLLRRRLADAFHNGCELAVLTTQPGSKSQENGHKQGFSLLYSRAILIRAPLNR